MKSTPKRLFYGWCIVAIGFLITATVQVAALNSANLFMVPVTEGLGISRSAFSIVTLIGAGVSMLLSPFAGKLLGKRSIRAIMTSGVALLAAAIIGYSFVTSIVQMYLLSIIVGACFICSTILPLSMLITRWFVKSRNTAMSIVFIGSSVGAMILSPVITNLIEGICQSARGEWRFEI